MLCAISTLRTKYSMTARADLVGVLAINKEGVPIELENGKRDGIILRKAAEEPEVMPLQAEFDAVERQAHVRPNTARQRRPDRGHHTRF
jgi:hypothetical protein